mmetsp:Transcript_19084/g.27964  ORF Transcript_19084/g.27964 Transcript_19084/m.27964 type:complete len:344 (+) Transcript_19084:33-1064(+)|eukprot:CAMPEP_0195507330 /NCGR_PEP_ID=MMETSP0794_2-20130614/798_1 /TAXON_ID=515487 /ORGANISM="Stephanopyxis turris, Strain CCMP 815" /LENGTH=343 /DNA_ID=CAMNT_0040633971 /DNA_START=33 /DNA_END=1064 /DNA_ORIENTATION=+
MAKSAPVVARLLLPDDANPAGNVHGGTILQLMEQAGMIAATRHCNSKEDDDFHGEKIAGLARIETMAFHQPMFVGEVASLTADIVFTSDRSVLVNVVVTAQNIAKGTNRITNTGELWYLSFVPPKDGKEPLIVSVPQVLPPVDDGPALDEYNKAKCAYEKRKKETASSSEAEGSSCLGIDDYKPELDGKKPSENSQTLCQLVLPGDCGISKVAFGGFIMKLMDNAAGCCAYKLCLTNVVTVSITSMDFVNFVKLGNIVTIDAVPAFSAHKSVEIAVTVSVLSLENKENIIVARGNFTFVSLNKDNKVIPVPRLLLESKAEIEQALIAQKRYEEAKQARLGKKG